MAFACVWATAALVHGANDDNPWPTFETPAPGPARSIGGYSAGCLQGAEALPFDGIGFQLMRPSRRRHYGHPALVTYIRQLARRMSNQKLAALLVGDLSQARGGRASNGHASHQTGLDVDLWYTSVPKKVSLQQREKLDAGDVVDAKLQRITPSASKRVTRMLQLAVDDARVDRVFVNPVIKKQLCAQFQHASERKWLRKVRPWFGHADHFHVRLACAATDTDCEDQAPLADEDGCDKLGPWLAPKRKGPANKAVRPSEPPPALVEYRRSIAQGNGWPEQCNALLGVL